MGSHYWKPHGERFTGGERLFLIIFHMIGMGPILREIYIIYYGMKERRLAKLVEKEGRTLPHIEGPYCPMPMSRYSFDYRYIFYRYLKAI